MTKFEYFIIFFSVLGVIFVILSVLQILLLRSKMKELWKQTASSEIQMRDTLVSQMTSDNRLQVYSLKINRQYTAALSTSATKFFSDIVDFALPFKRFTTLACDTNVQYVELYYKSVGFLVLDPCAGCEELVSDVMNEKVRYLIFNNTIFDARYSRDLDEKIKKKLIQDPVFSDISKCTILMVYNPYTYYNDYSCRFNMQLFNGETYPIIEDNKCIDLSAVLSLAASNSPTVLVYALAYKVSK